NAAPPISTFAGAIPGDGPAVERRQFQTDRIQRVSRVVSDLDRAGGFYRDAPGFRVIARGRSDQRTLAAPTNMAGLNGMLPACFMAESQLSILSRPLNGKSVTKQIRSSSGA
ncbi:MAG: VOC family protein, partial [Xanthobacteraceae bacterium]